MFTSISGTATRRRLFFASLLVAALVNQSVDGQAPLSEGVRWPQPPLDAQVPPAEVVSQWRAVALEKHQRDGRSASARGVIGSVSVAARCVEAYVASGNHRASAPDVKVVSAERRDCDGRGCRSYQVTAARDSTQPFDLEVSVTCS